MIRRLIPLLIAAMLCICAFAAAEGDTLAFDTGVSQVIEGDTLQTVLTREGDAAGGELTYKSSDARVASVDENGLVTAVKKGNVTITASVKTDKKTYKAQLKLAVIRPVTALTVKTDKLPLYEAADEKVAPFLTAREDAEENGLPVLLLPVKKRLQLTVAAEPKDASNRKVSFTSSDEAVFTAKQNNLTGVAPGEAILTIASESNPEITARYRVLVVQPVTKLAVEASAPFVTVGGQVTLTAKASPENATMQQVVWTSGSEKLATVDANGTVTGIKRGNARIIATAVDGSNVRANFNLKVVQIPESVTLAAEEVTIDVGKNQAVKAVVAPKDADNKKLIWSSSDESVATVGKDGRIKAVALGECVVTCTCEAADSVSASVKVHVQQPVKKVAFTDKKAFAYVGETTQLTWTVEPADATNQTIEFTSSKPAVATVDENGVVTGVSAGEAVINAVTTDGSKRRAKITVKVGEHVSGVHMKRRHAYIDAGESAQATAIIEPKNAINKNMTWTSSDESVVKVTSKGGEKMDLKGVAHGSAVVTGVTEDGGYEASIPVTVGDFDRGLVFRDFDFDQKGNFWMTVKNNTDVPVTSITMELRICDAIDGDNPPIPINTKDGSNMVHVVWNGVLQPGETTGKKNWKMENYKAPEIGMDNTRGTVVMVSYVIDGDWVKTIRKNHRVSHEY